MASELLAAGVDRDGILFRLYNQYRENRFRAMGCFLGEKLKLLPGGVAYAVFDRCTEERFGLEDGDTEGFVNMPLGIGGVRMSIFLKEDQGFFRVSVRSVGDCAASDFASRCFHGGGHFHAAGGRLYFPEDIPSPAAAAEYVEISAARFLQDSAPSKISWENEQDHLIFSVPVSPSRRLPDARSSRRSRPEFQPRHISTPGCR